MKCFPGKQAKLIADTVIYSHDEVSDDAFVTADGKAFQLLTQAVCRPTVKL